MKSENMDWNYSKPQIDNAFSLLGGIRGDDYIVGDKAIGNFSTERRIFLSRQNCIDTFLPFQMCSTKLTLN